MSLFEALCSVTIMSENFNIKRNDFQSDTAAFFRLFRDEDYLQDVTLVTDDQTHVSAHKLLLSASSDYFKSIFMKNRHQHPLICLQGVSDHELTKVLDYIYNGEATLPEDDVDNFMMVGKRLMLKGLVPDDEDVSVTKSEGTQDGMEEVKSVNIQDIRKDNETKIIQDGRRRSSKHEEIDKQLADLIEFSEDGTFSCSMCEKKDRVRPRLMKHIETHLTGLSYQCSECDKSYRTRSSLSNHKSVYHRGVVSFKKQLMLKQE